MNGLKKIKAWAEDNKKDLILAVSFFLAAVISFGLGRLSVLVENQRKELIKIERQAHRDTAIPEMPTKTAVNVLPDGNNDGKTKKSVMGALLYVGSKSSNKYHLPNCPGALRIKEENKVWFSSKDEAKNLGYSPASNCDGL